MAESATRNSTYGTVIGGPYGPSADLMKAGLATSSDYTIWGFNDSNGVLRFGVTTSGGANYNTSGVRESYTSGNLDAGKIQFQRTVTITSAAAGTAVNIVLDSEVPTGKKVYLLGFRGQVAGGTLWATTATVKVQDTNGTPVDFITVAVAAMTANANIFANTTNVTPENAYMRNTGGTASKGLQLKGNANGTGSDFIVTVYGYIA